MNARGSGWLRRVTVMATTLSGVACAAARLPAPSASDVPRLEASLRADSSAQTVRVQLAAAYREAGQAERAAALLEPLVRVAPSDFVARLFLGLSFEDLGRMARARQEYEAVLRLGPPPAVRRRVEQRLQVVQRLELREAVHTAVAAERTRANVAPAPRTVGVFPFLFAGRDTTLRPLSRALADMLSTDLAQTDRLRVLERAQLQYLVEEIRLTGNGYVDPASGARAGRILSAEHVVQGRIDGGQQDLSIQSLVVATASPRDSSAAPRREQGGLARLFEMEKNIALTVYSRLGVLLTAAERQRVNQRPTENVQALLAFGYGLEAQDAGRWAEAARHFARAAQLDPGFARARAMGEEAQQLSTAGATRDLAQLTASLVDLGLTAWQRAQLDFNVIELLVPAAILRDPTAEVLGTEGITSGPGIDIIIRRPGAAIASRRRAP